MGLQLPVQGFSSCVHLFPSPLHQSSPMLSCNPHYVLPSPALCFARRISTWTRHTALERVVQLAGGCASSLEWTLLTWTFSWALSPSPLDLAEDILQAQRWERRKMDKGRVARRKGGESGERGGQNGGKLVGRQVNGFTRIGLHIHVTLTIWPSFLPLFPWLSAPSLGLRIHDSYLLSCAEPHCLPEIGVSRAPLRHRHLPTCCATDSQRPELAHQQGWQQQGWVCVSG